MRLLRVALLMLLVLVEFESCDVHQFPDPIEPEPEIEKCLFTLNFLDGEMPVFEEVDLTAEPNSRSGESGHDMRYIIEVYPAITGPSKSNGRSYSRSAVVRMVMSKSDWEDQGRNYDFTPEVPAGNYQLVAWADYSLCGSVDDNYFDTERMTDITLRTDAYIGNSDFRDAFRGECFFKVDKKGLVYNEGYAFPTSHITVDMKRPQARFVFITTDLDEFENRHQRGLGTEGASDGDHRAPDLSDYRIIFRYGGYLPTVYNAVIDKPVDSKAGVNFLGKLSAIDQTSGSLGSDYVLVNGAETSVRVMVELYRRSDGERLAGSDGITVPIKRNHLTIVRGRFLTTNASGSVGINPDFDGEYNIEIK